MSLFQSAGTTWYEDFMYCKSCYELKQKGNFCPLCLQCYHDSDFTTKVITTIARGGGGGERGGERGGEGRKGSGWERGGDNKVFLLYTLYIDGTVWKV